MTERPNVLLVTADQWSGRWLGAAGHPDVRTPTLDQLARNGVRYTRAYSAHPVCIPARRTLMTGTTARTHGDRVFAETMPMPELPTLASTFSSAGYQCNAVGKLHVYPQRDRIGFDDVVLFEEGRHHLGLRADDYEQALADRGYAGRELTHAMGNNEYHCRPWHLPEGLHPTNWLTEQMSRVIKRRDPTRPAFWYLSYNAPHPPVAPPDPYLDMYRDLTPAAPLAGDWAAADSMPYALRRRSDRWPGYHPGEIADARRGFYAACTQLDHQLRLIIGMLAEEGLLDTTVISFTADHGDMLGNHGLYAKSLFYEDSCHVPLIIVPTADYRHLGHHQLDDRLVELRDVMPTLLDLAGVPIPDSVEGRSLLGEQTRQTLYGEMSDGEMATRMIINGTDKLVYYATGNRSQLFDLANDPDEIHDRAADPAAQDTVRRLQSLLAAELYGPDRDWLDDDGQLVGLPDRDYRPGPDRGLIGQRGWRFL